MMGNPDQELKVITCHLGNGSSITAVKDGAVVDTSMGLTPLDGFMMGTRCGSFGSLHCHLFAGEGKLISKRDGQHFK